MTQVPARSSSLRSRHGLALAFAAITLVIAGCETSRPEMEKFHTSGRVSPGEFPDVPAVVLLDRHELIFTFSAEKNRPYGEMLHTQRIQLMTKDALERIRVRIPYDDRSVVLHIQGRLIKPSGEIIDMPPDRAVDLPRFPPNHPATKLYDDKGFKLTKISGAEVGDVIEVSYLRVLRDPRWMEPIRISGDLPVLKGEVVIAHPTQFDVDFRVTRLGRVIKERPVKLPAPVKSFGDSGEGVRGYRHSFVFDRVRALYPEDLRPDADALATQVHVQLKSYELGGKLRYAFSTWDDVAKWYLQLTDGNDQPDASTKSALSQLGGAQGRKRDKLRRVQRFLQDEIEDVPTFLNLAALPAHPPGDILQAKVGDAKDQASLGLALLRSMGVDGFPVLVSRAGSYATVLDLPTPAAFNHVVIAVPTGGRFAWIDPSTPALPTGRLPGVLQGEKGLLIRGGRAELVDLPVDVPAANKRTLTYDLALAPDGVAQGQIRAVLDGLDAALAREILADGTDVTKRMKDLLVPGDETKLRWLEVLPVGGKKAEDPDRSLKLQIVLGAEVVAPKDDDGNLQLNVDAMIGRPLPSLWREVRYMPMVFDHRYEESVELTLSLPDSYGVNELPVPVDESGGLIAVKDRWALADGELALSRKLTLDVRTVDPDEYVEIREPGRAVWRAQATPIAIVKGGARGRDYGTDPF